MYKTGGRQAAFFVRTVQLLRSEKISPSRTITGLTDKSPSPSSKTDGIGEMPARSYSA
jgi:hypothetical protein